eukprot:Sspe_Gene.14794::Locus_5134_Transcript_1_4_Confidence_0.286_Length_12444::g.14794::m.14794
MQRPEVPRGPSPEDAGVLVSIRTGNNTTSRCVGALHLRLDTTLQDVRHQLVSLASAERHRKSRRRKESGHSITPPVEPPPAVPQTPQPVLTPEQRDMLNKIKLHPFDFTTPFQFVRRGGVVPIPKDTESSTKIIDVFPTRPNIGGEDLTASFTMPPEVMMVGREPPPPRKKGKVPTPIHGASGDYCICYAVLYVREGDGSDSTHSEKVVIERLLMQNNVFGRQQTPQHLATLINKHNANTRDFLGRTMLQECAQEGNYYAVAFLLELSFVDINAVDWRGDTALHLAVDRGHLEVMTLLLDANASVLVQNACGRTALHLALMRRADVLVARLCAKLHNDGITHDDLAKCVDCDGRDPIQLYALLSPEFGELCCSGQLKALRTLWRHFLFDRTQVFGRGMNGRTALHEAVEGGHLAVVDFLFDEVGFDVTVHDGCVDDTGRSPLHLACQKGATHIAKRLIQQGVDPNAKDVNLRTPLHLALLNKHWHVAEYILKDVPDLEVDCLDISSHTPLHIAASNGLVQAVDLLLRHHNANVHLRGEVVSVTSLSNPLIDLTSLPPPERRAFTKQHRLRQRRWKLQGWEEIRRDPTDGKYRPRAGFESLGRGKLWREAVRFRRLRAKGGTGGGPSPPKPGGVKDWQCGFGHQGNAKCCDIRAPTPYLEYKDSDQLRSGLGWLRQCRAVWKPQIPVIDIILRKPRGEESGLSWGDGMTLEEVEAQSPADKCGFKGFTGYRLRGVSIHLKVAKDDNGSIGVSHDGNFITSVVPGGPAATAGVKPGMRLVGVRPHHPGGFPRLPDNTEMVAAALDLAPASEPFTISVSISEVTADDIENTASRALTLHLQHPSHATRPQRQNRPGGVVTAVQGTTALYCSCTGQPAVTTMLIQHGAGQSDRDTPEVLTSTVWKAIDHSNFESAELVLKLMKHEALEEAPLLHRYVESTNPAAIRWLVEHGANCSATDRRGRTPLELAARQGDHRCLSYLIQQGAAMATTAPLVQAIKGGHEAAVSVLIHSQSRLGGPPPAGGDHPLNIVVAMGNLEMTKALLGVTSGALRTPSHSTLWVALEAGPKLHRRQPLPVTRGKREVAVELIRTDPQRPQWMQIGKSKGDGKGRVKPLRSGVSTRKDRGTCYESIAVFLCQRTMELQGAKDDVGAMLWGERHPLDILDLAASKGYWTLVSAVLELLECGNLARMPERPCPYVDDTTAILPPGSPRRPRANTTPEESSRNPSRASRRDVISYAAETGHGDVVWKLLVDWGVMPSPGREEGLRMCNALDYAFEGEDVQICLLLLSRGLLPTRHTTSSANRQVRLLSAAVMHTLAPILVTVREGIKGKAQWHPPVTPFPRLPVNILYYSPAGKEAKDLTIGQRVQAVHNGDLMVGTVTAQDEEATFTIDLDEGGSMTLNLKTEKVWEDKGHTILHELVSRGMVDALKGLVNCTATHPSRSCRFHSKLKPTTAGSLLYTAVSHKQETMVNLLVDEYRLKADTVHFKSPLVTALLTGQSAVAQKLVDSAAADVNGKGRVWELTPLLKRVGWGGVGCVVAPLYAAALTLDSSMVAFLRRQARGTVGMDERSESPLHGCLSVAPYAPGLSTPVMGQGYVSKRTTLLGGEVAKIGSLLVDKSFPNEIASDWKGGPPTHILNLAAKKGYFEVVRKLLEHGADPRTAVEAVCREGVHGPGVSLATPHVVHHLAYFGEVDLLKACLKYATDSGGLPDVLLPASQADEMAEAMGHGVLRYVEHTPKGIGSTADWAAWAQQAEALALLLQRGSVVSRPDSPQCPTKGYFMRFIGAPPAKKRLAVYTSQIAKGARREGKKRMHDKDVVVQAPATTKETKMRKEDCIRECRGLPPSGPQRVRGEGWDTVLTWNILVLANEVTLPASVRAGWQYIHAAAVRPGMASAGALLVKAGHPVDKVFVDPVVGALTPLWLAVKAGNVTLADQLLSTPAARHAPAERSPLAFAVLHHAKMLVQSLVELGQQVDLPETLWYPPAQRSRMFPPVSRLWTDPLILLSPSLLLVEASPLFLACYNGWEEMIKYLHANGASLQAASSVASPLKCRKSIPRAKNVKVKIGPKNDADSSSEDSEGAPKRVSDRMDKDIARRKEAKVKLLQAWDEEDDSFKIVLDTALAAYSSMKHVYRAATRRGTFSVDAFREVVEEVGGGSDDVAAVTRHLSDAMSYKEFVSAMWRGKKRRPFRDTPSPWAVVRTEGTSLRMRAIWGVVTGAPNHPLKITSKKKLEAGTPRALYDSSRLQDRCDKYIQIARYIVVQGGLEGLTPEEVTLLILIASHKGHWEMAALMLSEGVTGENGVRDGRFLVEVDDSKVAQFPDVTKRHPIHIAAERVGRDLFELFLKRTKKADITHLRDPRGFTALHCAIMVVNVSVVNLLVGLQIDVDNPRGGRPFGPRRRLVDGRSVEGDQTALMLAARVNSTAIITQLLKAGASRDAADSLGNTPLIYACEMGNVAAVEVLVSNGAQAGVINLRGYSALMRACVRGHDEVATPLLQYWTRQDGLTSSTTSVLHCAAEGGCEGTVERLLNDFESKSLNVLEMDDHPDSARCSALWLSWAMGRQQVKALFLEHLRRREKDGYPESPACDADRKLLARFQPDENSDGPGTDPEDVLLPGWLTACLTVSEKIRARLNSTKGGNGPNFPSELPYCAVVPALRSSLRSGCTYLRHRSSRGEPLHNLCQSHREKEMKVKAMEWSLLEWAVRSNHAVVVKVLGDHGVVDTCHALHMAAQRGNLDIVQIMLQLQMASVSQQDAHGQTALMRAISSKKQKVALFLMSKTPARRLLKLTPEGQSLLHLCAVSGMEDAVTHMIGCLTQLERRLKGEENLRLHDFIHAPDRHPNLTEYESEEEVDEEETPQKPKVPDVPLVGFTPFEYALMFNHVAVALRLAFASSTSQRTDMSSAIPLNPKFPGPAGCNLPIMSASVRAMIYEFFDDPSRTHEHAPAVIRGDVVRHPNSLHPDEETGRWPKEKTRVKFTRLTWPDVRVIGIAAMREIPWVGEKLSELLSLENERSKYSRLLGSLELFGRAFRLNYASLSELTPVEKLTVLQHLASTLIVHRYTPRDHDWTRSPLDPTEDAVGLEVREGRRNKRKKSTGRVAVPADGLAGQVSCVQLEYVTERSQVKVAVDSEGVVHERFTLVNGIMECGNLDVAMEMHFHRKERAAKMEADRVIRLVTDALRDSHSPLLQGIRVGVDWKSFDRYSFSSLRNRLKAFEALSTNQGLYGILHTLEPLLKDSKGSGRITPQSSFSAITFRRAMWDDGQKQFFMTQEARDEAAQLAKTEIPIYFDVKHGDVHFSRFSECLSPLLLQHEFDEMRRAMEAHQDGFKERLSKYLPDLKCKFEHEGPLQLQVSGADALLQEFIALLSEIEELLIMMTSMGEKQPSSRDKSRRDTDQGTWMDLQGESTESITFAALLRAAVQYHVRSIGVVLSPKREPTAKLATGPSRTFIACIHVGSRIMLPSARQLNTALYRSVMECEISRQREQMKATLADVQQRLGTYLPTTTLIVNWASFDELELEARFVAVGLFCHGRGSKVLQPLVSGMSVGWDSKLGVVVRRYVKTISIHCSRGWRSSMEFTPSGHLHYRVAMLAESTFPGLVAGTGSLLTTQEIASELMILLEAHEESLADEQAKRLGDAAPPPPRNVVEHVDRMKAFPCWCFCDGVNLRDIEVSSSGRFTIHARNILNQKCDIPPGVYTPEPFAVRIHRLPVVPKGTESITPIEISNSKKDHTIYTVTYTAPTRAGWYYVHASLLGIPLARSPFRLFVHPRKLVNSVKPQPPKVGVLLRGRPSFIPFRLLDVHGNICLGSKDLQFSAHADGRCKMGPTRNCGDGVVLVSLVLLDEGTATIEVGVEGTTRSGKQATESGGKVSCSISVSVLSPITALKKARKALLLPWETELRSRQERNQGRPKEGDTSQHPSSWALTLRSSGEGKPSHRPSMAEWMRARAGRVLPEAYSSIGTESDWYRRPCVVRKRMLRDHLASTTGTNGQMLPGDDDLLIDLCLKPREIALPFLRVLIREWMKEPAARGTVTTLRPMDEYDTYLQDLCNRYTTANPVENIVLPLQEGGSSAPQSGGDKFWAVPRGLGKMRKRELAKL